MVADARQHNGAHDKQPSASGTVAVRAEGIEKSFGSLKVLHDVSLLAPEGTVVCMIGASGSGKSTFLRCLNLLEMPERGEIDIAGEHVDFRRDARGRSTGLDRRQIQRLRAKATMVFQQFNLWPHMTALGNVIEAPVQVQGKRKAEAIELGESYLAKVGMSDKRDEYPAFLSGGQQQRIAIARALAMEPRVLLFDEPTSSLDPELVGEVLNVIRGLAEEGRTMILVTHEMSFAREVANEVIFLDQGVVAERGSPQALFESPASERCRQFISAVA
jgi:ABC-type histidine transport system ATPase subunit